MFGVILLANPILLIHGYAEDSSVRDSWKDWLTADNFTNVYTITFKHDDQCGSVKDHATELSKIINDMDSEKVDIITHSKGGLDVRNSNTDKVANLVMIGTPNRGIRRHTIDVTTCAFQSQAGREDLLPGSKATQVPDRESTNYTVAGNYAVPCYIVMERHTCYITENDGFVTVESAKSHYKSLGVFPFNHTALLTQKDIYEKVIHSIQ